MTFFKDSKITAKDFKKLYKNIEKIDVTKIRLSEEVKSSKSTRRVIGYEKNPGEVVPLYIRTPKDCYSPGISQYDENSPYKMGLRIDDDDWIRTYEAIWERIGSLLKGGSLEGQPLVNGYINPKLIAREGRNKTRFNGNMEDIPKGVCKVTAASINIASVFKQGSKHFLQTFVKECKYVEGYENDSDDDFEDDI